MNHLVALKDLNKEEIIELLELAEKFIDHDGKILKDPIFPDKKIVNIFCEPSTRTKISFEIAASNLGCQIIDFDLSSSSLETYFILSPFVSMNSSLSYLKGLDKISL